MDLKNLDALGLAGTRITNASMKTIGTLTEIAFLDLSNTRINDAGLREVATLKHLEELKLSPNQITDRAVLTLADLGLLHALQNPEPPAPSTPAELETLTKNGGSGKIEKRSNREAKPTRLDLSEARVTDAVMPKLAELQDVEHLRLRGTRITDAGLAHLAKMKTLKGLNVQNTRVTEAGIAKLRQALPDCRIESGTAKLPPGVMPRR